MKTQIDIEKALFVIKESGVCDNTSKRHIVYKRMYAAAFLRKHTLFSLEIIGGHLGNKSHCVVLHYLKTYNYYTEIKDELFYMYTKEIADQLNGCLVNSEKKQPLSWLEYAVINCASIKDLKEIQLKVLEKQPDENYFEMEEMLVLV